MIEERIIVLPTADGTPHPGVRAIQPSTSESELVVPRAPAPHLGHAPRRRSTARLTLTGGALSPERAA